MPVRVVVHVTRQLFEIDAHSYSFDFGATRGRRKGCCHLSDVIKYMSAAAGKRYPERSDDATQAGWAGGFLLERVLAQHAIEVECQRNRSGLLKIGELMWCYQCKVVLLGRSPELDADVESEAESHLRRRGHVGIFATPDAMLTRQWALLEWKFTKRTMRQAGGDEFIPLTSDAMDPAAPLEPQREFQKYEHISIGFWEWVVQMKGYCYLIGQLYGIPMLRALLMVLFVEGDYGVTTRDYTTVKYGFRFSERELEEGWDVVVGHAIDGELLQVEAA